MCGLGLGLMLGGWMGGVWWGDLGDGGCGGSMGRTLWELVGLGELVFVVVFEARSLRLARSFTPKDMR